MFTSQSGNSNPKLKTYFSRNEMQIFLYMSGLLEAHKVVPLEGKRETDKGSPALKGHDPTLPFGGFPIDYFPPVSESEQLLPRSLGGGIMRKADKF